MINIGRMNTLEIVEIIDKGCSLDADGENVFIPLSQMKEGSVVGDKADVFLYYDDGRLTATAKRPKALVGELANLEVVSSNKYGYFLNNGIRKDLYLPYDQSRVFLKEGQSVLVYVYLDYEKRLCCTAKYEKHFSETVTEGFKEGDRVKVLPLCRTPIGTKALVENNFYAMFLRSMQPKDADIKIGRKLYAFIKNIRDDQKVDLVLSEPGHSSEEKPKPEYRSNDQVSDKILTMLKNNNGYLPFNDRTDPKTILKLFGVSKGVFKKTVGNLYRQNKIIIEDNGLRLSESK